MKRVLLVVPFLILMLFSACENFVGEISPAEWTAMVATQTATMWTPTITPTFSPDLSKIKDLLNESFEVDKLEMTLDARYRAFDVWFPYMSDNSSRVFRLDIRCVCAINSHCCTPERMFVVTMHAMKIHAAEVIKQVPDNFITRVDVACHNNTEPLGVMGAPWSEVKAYILGNGDGSILAWSVTPNPAP
jgi:hypothetical protein